MSRRDILNGICNLWGIGNRSNLRGSCKSIKCSPSPTPPVKVGVHTPAPLSRGDNYQPSPFVEEGKAEG